jgi:hypothetical protein
MSKIVSESFEEFSMVIAVDGSLVGYRVPLDTVIRHDHRYSNFKTLVLELDGLSFSLWAKILQLLCISLTREAGFIKIVCLQVVAMGKFDGIFEFGFLIGVVRE